VLEEEVLVAAVLEEVLVVAVLEEEVLVGVAPESMASTLAVAGRAPGRPTG